MGTYRYIRASGVRKLVKENDKRCGADFLNEIDLFVYEIVSRCIRQHNGSRKTLDRTVAQFITGKIRT